eukprot:gene6740-14209_t
MSVSSPACVPSPAGATAPGGYDAPPTGCAAPSRMSTDGSLTPPPEAPAQPPARAAESAAPRVARRGVNLAACSEARRSSARTLRGRTRERDLEHLRIGARVHSEPASKVNAVHARARSSSPGVGGLASEPALRKMGAQRLASYVQRHGLPVLTLGRRARDVVVDIVAAGGAAPSPSPPVDGGRAARVPTPVPPRAVSLPATPVAGGAPSVRSPSPAPRPPPPVGLPPPLSPAVTPPALLDPSCSAPSGGTGPAQPEPAGEPLEQGRASSVGSLGSLARGVGGIRLAGS